MLKFTLAVLISLVSSGANSANLSTNMVFSPSSFWYTPIPFNTPLHENSAAFVTEFLRQKHSYYGTVAINTSSYTSPVYYAESAAKTVKVTQWDCQKKGYSDKVLSQQWVGVPIPSYAAPANGTDAEMTVYQPDTDTLWEFWNTRLENGSWKACWGGSISNASKSDGVFDKYYGATATSLPFIGGQITAEELQRGEIRHVIGIALVDLEKSSVFSWPAHRSDGYNPQGLPNRIPEGLRFRLDPTVNVDALKMHPVGKIIAKAAQKYGFVVWDHAGAIMLRAQNSLSYTVLGQPNPYDALLSGTKEYAVLNNFPWDKLQFLPMNYGKP